MENDLKSLNKLTNYFSRLYQPQTSFLLNCSNETDFGDFQMDSVLVKPTSLQLRKTHKSEDYTGLPSPFSLPQSSTFPLLNTPTPVEEKCPEGMFMLKKKFEDTEVEGKILKKKACKKSKQSAAQKCSHSVEIINLLAKFGIPLNLSSQVDECLKELNSRRAVLQTELEVHKSKMSLCNEASSKDNQSVISSLLDSNYESDTNSLCPTSFNNDLTLTASDSLDIDLANLPSLDSSTKSTSSSSSDKTLKQSPKLILNNIFLRQISDGYSSTCLSADSMSSELQAEGKKEEANPFFK